MNSDTIGIPKIWAQYMNNKDCSQGLCSFYCPQWCYAIFPPPPPPPEIFPVDRSSGPNFSLLVIAITGFFAGALLLVTYYAIISCIKKPPSTTNDPNSVSFDIVEPSLVHEPWFVASNGLDEALIKSIAMFEYRRGDGLVEGTDCSVCLSEFVEEERLRLLPKCSHAFHVKCIDTWLRRHSNCPLCRANVASIAMPPPPLALGSTAGETLEQSRGEMGGSGEDENVEMEDSRDPESRMIRRCLSMDSICGRRSSIEDKVCVVRLEECEREVKYEVRHSVMKRSHSSGRWFFSTYGKTIIPF